MWELLNELICSTLGHPLKRPCFNGLLSEMDVGSKRYKYRTIEHQAALQKLQVLECLSQQTPAATSNSLSRIGNGLKSNASIRYIWSGKCLKMESIFGMEIVGQQLVT